MIRLLRRRTEILPVPPQHAVTFYRDDHTLLDQLEGYVRGGEGAAAVVIASAPHRRELAHRVGTGAFAGFDAEESLRAFMVGGRPDPQRFQDSVGAMIRGQAGAGLRAYGEMVALLWAEGNVAGTLELEELWNQLQREVAFPLLCSYPLVGFAHRGGMGSICEAHSQVAPSVRAAGSTG